MKLEKLKKKNYHKIAIGGLIAVSILSVLIYKTTSAKYRTTQSINIAKGIINYKPYDLKVLAMYQNNGSDEYTAIDKMPSSGYAINESKSYCTLDGTNKDTNAILKTIDGNHTFANLSKNEKCYLYFDKVQTFSTILASYEAKGKISTARNGAITVDTEMENDKLYSVPDENHTTSYVYAGTNPNNYVQFGGFWWRIIRINGDGSIRLIYNGTSSAATGVGTQIQTSNATDNTAQQYNASDNHNAYVGYMYGGTEKTGSTYESTHTNTTSSTIKNEVDSWYNTNLNKTGIKEKIDNNGTFCNDRTVASGHSSYTGGGAGTGATVYAPADRLLTANLGNWKTNQNPSLICSQANNVFTATSATKGNKKLTYPVGLITIDEVVLAGGFAGTPRAFWLNTGQYYLTMSPCHYNSSGVAAVFRVGLTGDLNGYSVATTYGVRPVINLKASTLFKAGGTGAKANPYVVE